MIVKNGEGQHAFFESESFASAEPESDLIAFAIARDTQHIG